MKRLIGIWLGLLLALPAFANDDPQIMVKATADKVLSQVTTHKAELERDLSGLYALVEAAVVPHADFYRMSELALGKYRRQLSKEEIQKVADAFREVLVRTYATALLNYTGQEITYLPLRSRPGDTDVQVSTRVNLGAGGPPVSIDYHVHQTDDGWKFYDVKVDNISLVTTYRSQFAKEFRNGGVDGLVRRLVEQQGSHN